MVGFIIPIPGKVVDGVYDKGSQFVNSYKKQPVATDLSARQGSMDEKAPLAPPTRMGSTSQPPAYTPSSRQPAQQPRGRSEDFGPQLLDHVLSSLALLQSLGQITPEAAKRAAAALGSDYDTHAVTPRAPAPAAAAVAPPPVRRQNSVPAAPTEKRATALWDYGQNGDADDLVFSAGDTIIIDEEENENWYRGRTIPKGRSVPLPKKGLFPANYVQRH